MFVEKFLFLKVFPLCCLRWILQFAVFGCASDDGKLKKCENNNVLLETIQRAVPVWSKREFVQSAPLEQQVCILFEICFWVVFFYLFLPIVFIFLYRNYVI